jgi:cytochrome c oxidase subunit 1
LPDWLLTTDHKRLGIMITATALVLFFFGAVALTMRAQLAQPNQDILSPQAYLEFMTAHGTGMITMITMVITPLALGIGVYLVPLQIGAPRIAAPRAVLFSYYLYVAGAIRLIWGCFTPDGELHPAVQHQVLPGQRAEPVGRGCGAGRDRAADPGRHPAVDSAADAGPRT